MKKIALFAMSSKGLSVLDLIGARYPELLELVVTAKDPGTREDHYDQIRDLCKSLGVPCFDRSEKYEITAAYAIAVSWRWLIKLPADRLIVFHDSLLPKYRGFNPLVSQLINGERTIGVTALFAADEYDGGEIIGCAASTISYPIKIRDAIKIVSDNYVSLASEILSEIAQDKPLSREKQNEGEATYSLWRDAEDYKIDWGQSAADISRFIDSVGFPYGGAKSYLDGNVVEVVDAEPRDDVMIENRTAGKVIFLDGGLPVVVCGAGLLRINELRDPQTQKDLLPLSRFRVRFH